MFPKKKQFLHHNFTSLYKNLLLIFFQVLFTTAIKILYYYYTIHLHLNMQRGEFYLLSFRILWIWSMLHLVYIEFIPVLKRYMYTFSGLLWSKIWTRSNQILHTDHVLHNNVDFLRSRYATSCKSLTQIINVRIQCIINLLHNKISIYIFLHFIKHSNKRYQCWRNRITINCSWLTSFNLFMNALSSQVSTWYFWLILSWRSKLQNTVKCSGITHF